MLFFLFLDRHTLCTVYYFANTNTEHKKKVQTHKAKHQNLSNVLHRDTAEAKLYNVAQYCAKKLNSTNNVKKNHPVPLLANRISTRGLMSCILHIFIM